MAEGHRSLRRTKRRSPSASRSGRLHKRRNDEHESPESDITPKGTPEDRTIGELTIALGISTWKTHLGLGGTKQHEESEGIGHERGYLVVRKQRVNSHVGRENYQTGLMLN